MNINPTYVWDFINSTVVIEVITAFLTFLFTLIGCNIYFKRKAQSEQKTSFDKMIGDKIANALDTVRDIELSVKAREIYNMDELFEESEDTSSFFEQTIYYPEIMASSDSFMAFFNKVNHARGDLEKYLNYDAAAYLYYMLEYCMNVIMYAGKNSFPLDLLGTFIFSDFLNWQREFEDVLVELLNRPQFTIYSQNSSQWEYAKEEVMKQLWEKSFLYRLINDDDSEEIVVAKDILFKSSTAEELVGNNTTGLDDK